MDRKEVRKALNKQIRLSEAEHAARAASDALQALIFVIPAAEGAWLSDEDAAMLEKVQRWLRARTSRYQEELNNPAILEEVVNA